MQSVNRKIIFATVALMLACGSATGAKTKYQHVLDQLHRLSAAHLTYRYTIRLSDLATGRTIDSIVGSMHRVGNSYVDSSNAGFTALNGGMYCALDFKTKSATIVDVARMREKLGAGPERPAMPGAYAADSFALVPESLRIDTTNPYFYQAHWQTEHYESTWFTALVRKSDLQLTEFLIETTHLEHDKPAYRYSLSIHSIGHHVRDDVFNLNGVFTRNDAGIRLTAAYSGYKLQSLLK